MLDNTPAEIKRFKKVYPISPNRITVMTEYSQNIAAWHIKKNNSLIPILKPDGWDRLEVRSENIH